MKKKTVLTSTHVSIVTKTINYKFVKLKGIFLLTKH